MGLVAVLGGLAVGCSSTSSDDGATTPNLMAGTTAPPAAGTTGMAGMTSTPMAGSTTPTAGTTGGAGMTSMEGGLCTNEGEVDLRCPMMPPMTGPCAQQGTCCHRSSNKVKESMITDPNAPLELEYRVQFSLTTNHPQSIGTPLLTNAATARYEKEQQSTLWRFQFPRMGGQEVSGMGKLTIGSGRYNCDGTYSFFGDAAAPSLPFNSDVTRWKPREVDLNVDVTKTGADRAQPLFSSSAGREVTYVPFLTDPSVEYEWELANQGFTMTQFDAMGEGRDCLGKRMNRTWEYGGEFVIYTPLALNDTQTIKLISQTYCQLTAFGVLPDGEKNLACMTTPRCMPDGGMPGASDGGCPWVKLPDSLCPTTPDEKANWGCHLGVQTNINNEEGYPTTVNCTMEAPTGPLDPMAGATSEGQCCDPLGDADAANTLPACNAYRLVQKFVAAAAEITDAPTNEPQKNCLMP